MQEVGGLRPGFVLTQRDIAADRRELELDEAGLTFRAGRGKGVHAPINRAGKAAGQPARGDVTGLIQRLRIGRGVGLDLRHVGLAVRARNARLEEGEHLVQRPRKMHRRAFHQNVRAMGVVAKPEAEAAQHEIAGVGYVRIAAADGEAGQRTREGLVKLSDRVTSAARSDGV
ncbi:hypothetical protein ACVWW2_006923 [Bradyrhizobium sp. LM4.3]